MCCFAEPLAFCHFTANSACLKGDLVDDSAARLPEAHAVLGGGGRQEVIDLLVLLLRARKILRGGKGRAMKQRRYIRQRHGGNDAGRALRLWAT